MFPILASALLSFRRNRADPRNAHSTPLATTEMPPNVSLLALAPPITTMSSEPSLTTKVLNAMLTVLKGFLPPAPVLSPPVPAPGLSLVGLQERTVGLGQRVGTDLRGPFSVAALKGIRLEAVVRYQVWANTLPDVELSIQDLIVRLLGDRDALRAAGFLRLALNSTSAGENVETDIWRETADFAVLYEFPFVDSDGADSLIAQIPIKLDGELTESLTVSDEMTRWDNLSAPSLALRGRSIIGGLSALAFTPGTVPGGAVTLTRTFDGASGTPPTHPDLPTFLAAVTDPDNPAREGRVSFASLTDFLAAFSAAGDAITLGDWDEDLLHTPDSYQSLALPIEPPITLPGVADRFEITYQITVPSPNAVVVYLRDRRTSDKSMRAMGSPAHIRGRRRILGRHNKGE
jgi:hypothetical protein